MKQWIGRFGRSLIRTSAFIGKELFEILRQRRLVLTLIIGPFLILLLFGIGYRETPIRPRTVFVVPEGSQVRTRVEEQASTFDAYLELVDITEDSQRALQLLREGDVNLVIETANDPAEDVMNNQQSEFNLYHAEIDPFEQTFYQILASQLVRQLNEDVLLAVADQGKAEAESIHEYTQSALVSATGMRIALEEGDRADARLRQQELQNDFNLISLGAGSSLAILASLNGSGASELANAEEILQTMGLVRERLGEIALEEEVTDAQMDSYAQEVAEVEADLGRLDQLLSDFRRIDSHVLISPFRARLISVTEIELQVIHFFVPGTLALLLQHTMVTMAALSIVRERREGTIELFRAAPISAFETLLGKYTSYLVLGSLLALVLTLAVTYLLGVPMLGEWSEYVLITFIFLFASLGIGFNFSLSAQTDSQAVQYSMILLLASIFFSGFMIALRRFWVWVQVISWMLPATYGTSMLQDVMLRGRQAGELLYIGLAMGGVALFLLAWWRLNRTMTIE